MASSVNKVILLGNLGKDAETKFTPSGVSVSNFSVATSRKWKDGEEWKEKTDWHNVTIWRAEKLAQYLTKGTKVYVEGRLETRSYEKDGRKVYVTDVIADQVVLCGGGAKQPGERAEEAPARAAHPVADEDIPF